MAAAAMVGLMAAGSVMTVISKIQEGNAAKRAAEYNAQIADQNAIDTRLQAAEDETIERTNNKQTLGSIRAQYGASGLRMDGTPTEYLEMAAAIGERNALQIRNRGERQAMAYQKQAKIYRETGSSAQVAGILGAVGAGLDGATKIAGVNMKRTA